MSKYIRAVKLPSGDLLAIEAIVAVKRFEAGVGILDLRNRMIGWIEVEEEDEDLREEHFVGVLDIFDSLINDRRRAQQPDWGFLTPALKKGAETAGKKRPPPQTAA